MISRAPAFILAGLLFIVAAGLPARYFLGERAVVYCATAVLLCLVPGLVTLLWAGRTLDRDPQMGALAALGGSGVRMFGVLLLALLIYTQVPFYREGIGFLLWVLAAYLYLLAAEIWLLLRGRHSAQPEEGKTSGA